MSSHGFCILCGVNLDQETNYCKTCWHISDDYHSSGGKGKAPEPNKKALLRLLHSQEGMNQIISKENSFLMKELKTFGFGERKSRTQIPSSTQFPVQVLTKRV